MSPDPEQFMKRLEQIDAKLKSYARHFAYQAGFMDADDLYQTAVLKLWERYCNEPDLLEKNNNSYLWFYGVWMMKNAVNHERYVWVNKVVDLFCKEDIEPKLTIHFPNPESEAVRDEVRSIVRQMPEDYQALYTSICQGYLMKEIQRNLGVRKEILAKRKRKLIENLGAAWRVPPSQRKQIIQDIA